jgi:hypothetical protein
MQLILFLRTGALALLLAGLVQTAAATELSRKKLSNSTNVEHCSVYGPGYVRVEGSEACARIGGRMRVERQVNRPPAYTGFPSPFEAEPGPDGPARARLRLDALPARDPHRTLSR